MTEKVIILNRVRTSSKATLGNLFINNLFICNTLEKENGPNRRGLDRIPAGEYTLQLRTEGGKHAEYSRMFDFHEGMIEVANVPDRSYILFHIGNFYYNSDGCILVGHGSFIDKDGELAIAKSRDTYKMAYPILLEVAKRNGKLIITDEVRK